LILHGEQIRAARGLLGWSQADLSEKAGVGLTTIRRFEGRSGPVSGTVDTVVRIKDALQSGGVIFLDQDAAGGIGVRLRMWP